MDWDDKTITNDIQVSHDEFKDMCSMLSVGTRVLYTHFKTKEGCAGYITNIKSCRWQIIGDNDPCGYCCGMISIDDNEPECWVLSLKDYVLVGVRISNDFIEEKDMMI